MEFRELAPNGPVLLIPKIIGDERGYFMETFRQNEFVEHCGKYEFVQDNQSRSAQGVLRGLHYQLKNPQGKLVRVIEGKVFDAVVDLRISSATFGKSFNVYLDAESCQSLWVPPGFAHGFIVLSEQATFVYKCTTYYTPGDEYCLFWRDPDANVKWPLEGIEPQLSAKDKKGTSFAECPKFD